MYLNVAAFAKTRHKVKKSNFIFSVIKLDDASWI